MLNRLNEQICDKRNKIALIFILCSLVFQGCDEGKSAEEDSGGPVHPAMAATMRSKEKIVQMQRLELPEAQEKCEELEKKLPTELELKEAIENEILTIGEEETDKDFWVLDGKGNPKIYDVLEEKIRDGSSDDESNVFCVENL